MATIWTQQREKVFSDRYARKGSDGVALEKKPDDTWQRVASAIGQNNKEREEFYNLLKDWKFVPGGRILAGAGTNTEVTYYNCFVLPIKNTSKPENGNDSREAIFDTISRMVDTMSRGGGVGINWSTLRPNGAYLSRINGTTTGPMEWMDVASKAVGAVMQGGSRRGAAMFMLNDWHPDIESFINGKRDLAKITNANISVAVSDDFMKAVKADGDWALRFPDTSHGAYNLDWDGDLLAWESSGKPVIEYRTVKARELWRKMAEAAWDNGEPGVIFLERYNKLSTGASIEKIICVNPCGEQGLGEYSVCNLGAMNLDAYVSEADRLGPASFNADRFANDVRSAVKFLDNVIDDNNYGDYTETYFRQMELRRIGLGVMGLADALIHLGLRYGSPEAIHFVESYGKVIKENALRASVEIASRRGAAIGWEEKMIDRPFLHDIPDDLREDIKEHGLRNLFLLTQAPTGTTSIVAGVSSGIEPHFAFRYGRNDRTGSWDHVAYVVQEWEREHPQKPLPPYFVASGDITVEDHIYMQAAVQKYIDSSVSKTLNAPNSHKVEDVEKAYTLAYDCGLKSIAYFRDGCGRAQVLVKDEPKKKEEAPKATAFVRQSKLVGETHKINTSVGTAFISVNQNKDGSPIEVFVNVGKAGTDVAEFSEAIGRLISISLQNGVTPNQIVSQMIGIGGYSKLRRSLPSAIAQALSSNDQKVGSPSASEQPVPTATTVGSLCPNCQSFTLLHEEGCMRCVNCTYSAC